MDRRATLSVCMQTNVPAARVAAIFEPLRGVASEFVVAVDSRVDERELGRYGAITDVLRLIEFGFPEQHLQWLHRQCSGDWILLLDDDEVVSAALVERLPELLQAADVRQYVTPRRWLHPDALHWLDELPWSADWITRLVRNEPSLRFSGVQHLQADVALPRAFIEPPIYHLDLLVRDERMRRGKSVRYEVLRPGIVARGGGRFNEAFYLPELRVAPRLRELAAEDAARVGVVLDPPELPAREMAPPRVVPLTETNRMWERRSISETAYRATLEPLESNLAVLPGEHVEVLVRVHNDGDVTWPWALDHHPQIRLGHRWFDEAGQLLGEGARAPFPKRVEPGERLLAPVAVLAPEQMGSYQLEIDVVHEDVRWFGSACRIDAVVAPSAMPPVGERLKPTAPDARGEVTIPRVFHRVWLGDAQLPAEHVAYADGFARLHPEWEQRLWTDEHLSEFGVSADLVARSRSTAEMSNLLRYEVLARHGGVYLDTDVECLRPFDELLVGASAFAGLELPGRLGSAVLASAPGHPLMTRAAREARTTLGLGANSADTTGPYFLTLLAEQEPGLTIFGPEVFYPYLWNELERSTESFPQSFAVHRWAMSWYQHETAGR